MAEEKNSPRGLGAFGASLAKLHHPQQPQDLAVEGKFWARLAYDELLSHQLALRLVRAKMQIFADARKRAMGD